MSTRTLKRLLVIWLGAGSLLLLVSPLQAWTPLLGWGPALWLLVSPLLMLLALQPRLPLQWLAAWLRRRAVTRRCSNAVAASPILSGTSHGCHRCAVSSLRWPSRPH